MVGLPSPGHASFSQTISCRQTLPLPATFAYSRQTHLSKPQGLNFARHLLAAHIWGDPATNRFPISLLLAKEERDLSAVPIFILRLHERDVNGVYSKPWITGFDTYF